MALRNADGRQLWVGLVTLAAVLSTGCNTSPAAKEAKFLKAGKSLMEKKDFSRAVLQFKNATQVMPKDAEASYQLGLALLATHDVKNAYAAFRKATQLNPKHAAADLKVAELLAASSNKDQVQQAASRLEDVLAITPDNPEANDTLAEVDWKLGRTDEAVERLEQTLQRLPAHLQSSVQLARLKLFQKDIDGAIEVMQKAAASAPQSAPAALALGQLYWTAKQSEKAEAEIRRSLKLDPQNGPALRSLASILTAANRMAEADATYRQLAALPDKQYRPAHALFLYQTGKRDAAMVELKQLYQRDPSDRTSRNLLVSSYVEMGKMAEAQNLLAAVLKSNPKDGDALYQQSVLSMKSGKLEDADAGLKKVLHLHPDSAQAHLALADVNRARGLVMNQRQELNEALRLQPTMIQARLALAKNLNTHNEGKAALQLLDRTPDSQKRTVGFIVERNWALLATGNTKEVRSILDQALRTNRFPELVLQDSVLRMSEKDFAGSRASAEEILSRYPQEPRAARLLVNSYAAQGPSAKLIDRLLEAEAKYPTSAPLRELIGQWYIRNGNLTEARKVLESARAADPKFLEANLDLAELDHKENHPDAARQRLAGIVAANPRNVSALLLLAGIEAESGDKAASIGTYRSVLDLDASNLAALKSLSYQLALQNPDEALKFAQQAVQAAPDDPTVQDALGWVYYRKGIYDSAITYLKAALSREPTPGRRFHLAMTYLKSGDRATGQPMLLNALKDDPDLAKKEQGW